jgi:hypothetical protein
VNKYEDEIQRLLSLCGGDWETLARWMFWKLPEIVAEVKKDDENLARAFASSTKIKRGRKADFTFDDVMAVLARLNATKYDKHGRLKFKSRMQALKAENGLNMRDHRARQWTVALSKLPPHVRRSWSDAPLKNEFSSIPDVDAADHGPCTWGDHCADMESPD